jgi:hypothetical protein
MSKIVITASVPQADFYSRLYCPKCNLIYCEKASHVQGNGFVISSLVPKLKCNKCGGELVSKSFSPDAAFGQGVLAIVGAILFLLFVAVPLGLLGQSITGMALVFVPVGAVIWGLKSMFYSRDQWEKIKKMDNIK